MGKTICVSNRKGGVGKTMTAVSLGVGLAKSGASVLLLDADPQHSLTISLGVREPDKLPVTLTTAMDAILRETPIDPTSGILHHSEGIDFLPANNSLSGTELALASVMVGRETILRQYIDTLKPMYDFVIVDTSPSLGLLTINALTASDCVLIPVIAGYLDAKGLELLLKTISQVQRHFNPNLAIGGILLTMVDKRMNYTREIISLIESAYGSDIHIFRERIPRSVRAAETSAEGKSIFAYDPTGKVAAAYATLTEEVLKIA
ncbi:MAG: AAA family ATPase [Oscillospiraceae bacterium]|nr:AAA family ATPase [Oscillospiraceae bacterium]